MFRKPFKLINRNVVIFIKKFFLSLTLLLLFTLFGCQHSNDQATLAKEKKEQVAVSKTSVEEKNIREAVWDQLPSVRKEQIKGTWKDAYVKKETLNETVIKFAKPLKDWEFYIIDFQTKNNFIPNNMIVYANVKDYKIIGYGIVD